MEKIYDFIGVGIGPYNLSLAALTEDIAELEGLFFDEKNEMEWHPGMLIDGTDLQTSFIADLVTFADPTNKYSFLNYLHKRGRLYKFYYMHILEMPRQEITIRYGPFQFIRSCSHVSVQSIIYSIS